MGEFGPFGPRRCGRTTKQLKALINIAKGDGYSRGGHKCVYVCMSYNYADQLEHLLQSMCNDDPEVMCNVLVVAAKDFTAWRELRRRHSAADIFTDHAAWEFYMRTETSNLSLREQGLLMRDYTICAFTAPPEERLD